MGPFIIILLCVGSVKARTLSEMRDIFFDISSRFLGQATTSTQPSTDVTFINEDDYYHKHRAITKQSTVNVMKRKVRSTQYSEFCKEFNLTWAIEKGQEFQAEFCSMKCEGNSSNTLLKVAQKCLQSLCGLCQCDSDCSENGDCCELKGRAIPTNNSTPADNRTDYRYSCFPKDANTAIYIIASCPTTSYLGDLKGQNTSTVLSQTVKEDGISQTDNLESDCNTCLHFPESIHLITSGSTGVTYCNPDCLICNEARLIDALDSQWREERSCSARNVDKMSPKANISLGNVTEDLETECKITFQRPEGVSTRECDRQGETFVVNTCSPNLSGSTGNLSSEAVDRIHTLCQAYSSPVYEGDVIYQNIFCYLCQCKVPDCRKHRSDKEDTKYLNDINLSLLTELEYSYYEDKSSHEEEVPGQIVSDEPEYQEVTSTCRDGYWKDESKGSCFLVRCVSGRHVSRNTSISEAYCQLDDDQDGSDLYKLNIIWYVWPKGDCLNADCPSHHNHFSDIEEANGPDMYNRRHLIMIDVNLSQDKHPRKMKHLELKPLCKEITSKWELHESGNNPRDRLPFVKSKRLDRLSSSKVAPLSGKHEPNTRSDHVPPAWKSFNSGSDKNIRLSEQQLIQFMKQHIGSTLKTMAVVDFIVQFYHLRGNNQDLKRRGNERMSNLKEETKSSGLYMQPVYGVGAVVYLVFNSGVNRDVFESNVLKNFSGIKTITTETGVVTIEQALSNPETVIMNTEEPVFLSDSVNGDCCSLVTLKETSELINEVVCWDEAHRVIHFSAITSCPHVIFNISDFNISRNFELVRNDVNITLHTSQYLQQDGSITACITSFDPTFNNPPEEALVKNPLLASVDNILTLVALTLSLVCLLMTLITYVVFPSLRSLPGKHNMILVSWLFAAQLLFLLNPLPLKHSTVCTVLGVMLHYAWLSTLSWTCVSSYHMFHVFVVRRGSPTLNNCHKWYLFQYLLVSNLASITVVFSVIFSSLHFSGGKNCGYGGRNCYLRSPFLVGIAFLLPLSLVLLLNCIFFTLTIYAISHIKNVKRQCGRERRNVHVYIRLSSLTGLCWLLALLAEIPGLQPLRCVSVLVNGCQGVTLFLSFVCNRRVKRMWCHLVRSKHSWQKILSRDSNQQITVSSSL